MTESMETLRPVRTPMNEDISGAQREISTGVSQRYIVRASAEEATMKMDAAVMRFFIRVASLANICSVSHKGRPEVQEALLPVRK